MKMPDPFGKALSDQEGQQQTNEELLSTKFQHEQRIQVLEDQTALPTGAVGNAEVSESSAGLDGSRVGDELGVFSTPSIMQAIVFWCKSRAYTIINMHVHQKILAVELESGLAIALMSILLYAASMQFLCRESLRRARHKLAGVEPSKWGELLSNSTFQYLKSQSVSQIVDQTGLSQGAAAPGKF